jgi:hypothetical protein
MNIPADLDELLDQAAAAVGVPATRDPQLVRAHIAQTGVCLTCTPASGAGRTQHGQMLTVPVHLVLPQLPTLAAVDRALQLAPDLAEALGCPGWDWDEGIPVGADTHPGFTFVTEITVC